ncbi:uncharacterized protein DEA37_0000890 [Paragonimus westermani]|uniref:Uncharacterized protein n=1 Tax=Paragonimus westermani TaxID=34504 RepID=A0A5J4NWA3_9TREM|nr:uncharacterized protein DEA37_0000890 [Paragonimus westermani]
MARSMKELLRDYEIRAERYETTVSDSIRKQLKKALDDDRLLTRFLVDPQDRRPVEYWDDEKLIKVLQGDPDESAHKRKKAKQKHMKEDKPELLLDGNPLEAEGVIALLSQLSEAAESEGFERVEETKRKQQALEDMKRAARINLDRETVDLDVNAEKVNATSPVTSPTGKPDDNIKEENITKIKGKQFASIISHSKDLQEIDLFANEIGDLGARQILEGLIARKDAKLPQIGVRMGYRINQDTFDIIHKLAPGPKKKGKGKKRK